MDEPDVKGSSSTRVSSGRPGLAWEPFAQAVGDIRSLVTCKICTRLMYEPYVTRCGHAFCYSCLSQWLKDNQKTRECPECRGKISQEPSLDFTIRNIVHVLLSNSAFLEDGDTTEKLAKEQQEAAASIDHDKKSNGEQGGGLFNNLFKKAAGIFDPSDGVHRCPRCNWELEGPYCMQCDEAYSLDGSALEFSNAESDFTEDEDEDDTMHEEEINRMVRRPLDHARRSGWESEAEDGISISSGTDDELWRIRHAALTDEWRGGRSHFVQASRDRRPTPGTRTTASEAFNDSDADENEILAAEPGNTTAIAAWPTFSHPSLTDEAEFDSEIDDFIEDDDDEGNGDSDMEHDFGNDENEDNNLSLAELGEDSATSGWRADLDDEVSLRSDTTTAHDFTETGYDSESSGSSDSHLANVDYQAVQGVEDDHQQEANESDLSDRTQIPNSYRFTPPHGRKRRMMMVIDDTDDDEDGNTAVEQEGRARQRRRLQACASAPPLPSYSLCTQRTSHSRRPLRGQAGTFLFAQTLSDSIPAIVAQGSNRPSPLSAFIPSTAPLRSLSLSIRREDAGRGH